MASQDKNFLDTNVALDHLADRQPFSEYAHRILALAETGEITLCISAHLSCHLYYLLRKLKGHDASLDLLRQPGQLAQVSTVSEAEIHSALSSGFKDFEEGIQYFAAKAEGGIDAIVTRNKADYSGGDIPLYAPDEYLSGLAQRTRKIMAMLLRVEIISPPSCRN